VQCTEDEDQNDILMIGGISIFLPFAPEEVENCIADIDNIRGTVSHDCQTKIRVDGWDCPRGSRE
jgi:hypothetical protein